MDELKTDVIRTVSHQLKTPLTSIRMVLHLLLEEKVGPITEKQVELLLAAREDSDRLHEILTNLLDISRLEAGKAPLDLDSLSPHALVLDAVEPYRRTAQDQGVSLFLEIRGNLPRVRVDRSRVGHVFGNLITNALQHTLPGGRITVSLREEEEFIRFLITDTGPGVPESYRAQVFEPFFRVPDGADRGGAGLGLAIAKEIVEAHGGQVGLDSGEGRGSTFWFKLRRADRGEDGDSARKEG
jgi:NtrC-family two-component system sensor histidine kinase KinB